MWHISNPKSQRLFAIRYSLFAQEGFTLTELLVTISIFSVLLGIAGLSFRNATKTRELRQAADEVRSIIYQARALALAPAIDKTPQSPGYRFTLIAPDRYRLAELPAIGEDAPVPPIIAQNTLPRGIVFAEPPPFTDLDFSIEQQGRIIAPAPPSGRLELALERTAGDREAVRLVIYTATGQVERLDE